MIETTNQGFAREIAGRYDPSRLFTSGFAPSLSTQAYARLLGPWLELIYAMPGTVARRDVFTTLRIVQHEGGVPGPVKMMWNILLQLGRTDLSRLYRQPGLSLSEQRFLTQLTTIINAARQPERHQAGAIIALSSLTAYRTADAASSVAMVRNDVRDYFNFNLTSQEVGTSGNRAADNGIQVSAPANGPSISTVFPAIVTSNTPAPPAFPARRAGLTFVPLAYPAITSYTKTAQSQAYVNQVYHINELGEASPGEPQMAGEMPAGTGPLTLSAGLTSNGPGMEAGAPAGLSYARLGTPFTGMILSGGSRMNVLKPARTVPSRPLSNMLSAGSARPIYQTFPEMEPVAATRETITKGKDIVAREEARKESVTGKEDRRVAPPLSGADVEHLTDRVYELLERRIRIEKERRGL